MNPPPQRKPWYRILYVQVLIAVALGIAIGHFWPDTGQKLKPLGDAFIRLVKMVIAPIFGSSVCGSMLKPTPGFNTFTTISPMMSASVETISK